MPGFSWRAKQYASARMAVGIKKNSDKKSKQKKRRSENPLVYSYKVPKNIMHGPHPIIIYL